MLNALWDFILAIPRGVGQSLGTALGILVLGSIGLAIARWRDRKTQSQRDVIHVSLTMFTRVGETAQMAIRPSQSVPLEAMFVRKSLVAAVKSAARRAKDKARIASLFKALEASKTALPPERITALKSRLKGDVDTILIPDLYERAVALNAAINAANALFQDGLSARFAGRPIEDIDCVLALTSEQTVEHRMPRVMIFRQDDIAALKAMIEADTWRDTIKLAQPHHADRLTTLLEIALLNEIEEAAAIPEQERHVRRFVATVRS